MKKPPVVTSKSDQQKTHEELLKELSYLRAENAYLKKLKALIQQEEAQRQKQQSLQN